MIFTLQGSLPAERRTHSSNLTRLSSPNSPSVCKSPSCPPLPNNHGQRRHRSSPAARCPHGHHQPRATPRATNFCNTLPSQVAGENFDSFLDATICPPSNSDGHAAQVNPQAAGNSNAKKAPRRPPEDVCPRARPRDRRLHPEANAPRSRRPRQPFLLLGQDQVRRRRAHRRQARQSKAREDLLKSRRCRPPRTATPSRT